MLKFYLKKAVYVSFSICYLFFLCGQIHTENYKILPWPILMVLLTLLGIFNACIIASFLCRPIGEHGDS